jgi:hypothetical protein
LFPTYSVFLSSSEVLSPHYCLCHHPFTGALSSGEVYNRAETC